MVSKFLIATTLCFLTLTQAFASSQDYIRDEDELIITDVSFQEVEPSLEAQAMAGEELIKALSLDDIGDIITIGNQLIAFGTKIWDIIKEGRPNVNVGLAQPISILPNKGSDAATVAFYNMDQWSAPIAKTFRLDAKNALGSILASFEYNVVFMPNGRSAGKGRYITGLQVKAGQVYVKWGVSFDATSALVSVANRGTIDDPIGSGIMQLDYTISTVFSHLSRSESFYVAGNGEFAHY